MANLRFASRPPRTPATLYVSNPTDGSEPDSSLSESYTSYDTSSECDTDDLSMKERIRWRAGAMSPYLSESYPRPKTPSPPPPRYSPSTQLALGGGNVSRHHQQEAEELDINYLGILSPPPRVFYNPHPSYHDYDIPDRFSVRDFLEAPGPEDFDKVEGGYHPPSDVHDFGVGMMRPPTRALQPTKPLQIHRQKWPDPPAMYWDPISRSMRSYSIYSQDSAPHGASQYRSSPHPQPMRPGVSTSGSAFGPSALSSSDIYRDEPDEYPLSMRTTPSMVQTGAPSLGASQYHRPRRRGPLGLDNRGLPLIDEQKESTFTPADSQYPRNQFSNPGSRYASQVPPTPRQSTVPPHSWVSEIDEKFPQTTVSRQPGRHPPMRPRRRIGNRNAKRMPYSSDGKRDWSSDLCMFCDHNLGTCCAALWCPCIIYARNKSRIEHLYVEERVHPKRGDTCSQDCAIHACMSAFCLFGWAVQIPNRAAVRRRYDIEGDCIGDFAATLFCSPCELSQESREIDLEEMMWSNE